MLSVVVVLRPIAEHLVVAAKAAVPDHLALLVFQGGCAAVANTCALSVEACVVLQRAFRPSSILFGERPGR